MKEVIMYKSENGELFEDKLTCILHEMEASSLTMYGVKGKTDNPFEALILVLGSKAAASTFLDLCEAKEQSTGGITEEDTGMFVWSYPNHQYFKVDPMIADTFKHID